MAAFTALNAFDGSRHRCTDTHARVFLVLEKRLAQLNRIPLGHEHGRLKTNKVIAEDANVGSGNANLVGKCGVLKPTGDREF